MPVIARTVALLMISNLFMTFAWYAHLRNRAQRPWPIAALASWGIAQFEYLFQVPANRLEHIELSLLKILREVITMTAFGPFACIYMKDLATLNYQWMAERKCGAVFSMVRM